MIELDNKGESKVEANAFCERPTEYYDERISKIDEQICEMLKIRKQISNNNLGFPLNFLTLRLLVNALHPLWEANKRSYSWLNRINRTSLLCTK
ncbi:unknown protein [Paenibacillus amylolyticus]|uniref:Uncharacterized protein n=1 Tax=Paenibacillus amylolyticus TaxID=1451 RepID=A0A100VLM5_PAEAM|nr:unknown protein [Paenibacillus amylolyticus]